MDNQNIKNRFGIIGNTPALNHALDTAVQVAATDLSVLIAGESGVGKEAFSNIIHALSSRKHNPFIAVNCGAIPEGTIDSELFGHEKGSFTGAVDARKGYFETVNGGTIFLDEIGEMPLGTQARLLRVLESGEFIRVGSSKVQKTDVRVIAATNRDLLEHAQNGRFREDLYYRLSTVPIRVPSLRDRKEDIPLLFRKFTGDFAERYKTQSVQLDANAQQVLMNYPWPGNVRELKNIAEQISVLSTEKVLTADALQRFLPNAAGNRGLALLQPAGMPIPSPQASATGDFNTTERDILYKLFFELKKDMTEIKQMLYEMGHQGTGFAPVAMPDAAPVMPAYTMPAAEGMVTPVATPIVLHQPNANTTVDHHEDVEESLMLTDREKEFIVKSLKKHKGRRRDAANELGISERTLYRKIKEYDIKD
ncbi:sigma-54-dependent Fis family transcriptional regulator [Chitinophagaceae bacterium IBVUCB1]|nr:sigma-54-dependent Fis family transcriptional regulator [Chitinophagaceae bacterium IBVUCB1]